MIGPLFIGLKIRLEVVRGKKQFKHGKHDNELDRNDLPQGPATVMALNPLPVKGIDVC